LRSSSNLFELLKEAALKEEETGGSGSDRDGDDDE